VWPLAAPCSLLCQFHCGRHGIWCWQPLEVQVPVYVGGRPKGTRRRNFAEMTGTPIVQSFDEALAVLNTRHFLLENS
jgi:hypothetical protein